MTSYIPPMPEFPPDEFEQLESSHGGISNNGSKPKLGPGFHETPDGVIYTPDLDSYRTSGDIERFVIRDAAFALQPQPAIDWVVENLFSAGSVSLLVGPAGSKKTRSMLSAAVRVAIGAKWITFETTKCPVLFIDEESGERRFARWLGESLRGEFGSEDTPVKFISLARLDLFKDDSDAFVLKLLIDSSAARLVIIDALADIMPGGDENAVKDVHPVFMRLRKIADETGAAIVVIHHSNKAGDYRGSTAMSGAVDLLLMVDSKNGSPIIEFESKKARDVEPIRFAAQIHFDQDMTWLSPIEAGKAKRTPGEEYVLRILHDAPMSLPEIESNADTCSSRMARDAVYKLSREGAIYRTNPGETGRGHPAIYDIRIKDPANEDDK